MRTNMKFWPAKRMLCLALCILMLVVIAMPSMDAFTWAGSESLLGRLFGVTQAMAYDSITVTYNSGDGTFESGGTTNTVSYSLSEEEITKYAHTPNISDDGSRNGGFGTYRRLKSVITIPNADSIHVEIRYGTYNSSRGVVYVIPRSYSGNITSNYGNYGQIATLSGYTASGLTASYNIEGDTATFGFWSDSNKYYNTSNDADYSYGYYAVVTGVSKVQTITGGQYLQPSPNDPEYRFKEWNTEPDGSGNTVDPNMNMVELGNGANIYAIYEEDLLDENSKGEWWRIKGDGTLIIGNGPEMTIPVNQTSGGNPAWPWYAYSEQIQSARFIGTVHANPCTRYMFCGPSITSIDFTNFDTSNVTDMNEMFRRCSSLTSLDVSGFDTSKVINMSNMFSGCSSLTNLDVSNFDTSKVTSMSHMFAACTSLKNIDVSTWNTISLTDSTAMFYGCSSLTELDLSGWATPNLSRMGGMFAKCTSLKTLMVENLDVSNVTEMIAYFTDPLNETSYVAIYASPFSECTSLQSLDLSSWDTSKVQSFGRNGVGMFSKCSALESVNLSGWDVSCSGNTSGTGYLDSMFQNCKKLKNINMNDWKWEGCRVRSMNSMFANCSSLTSLDVSGFDTSNVTSMSAMFAGCSALPSLDLSEFNTSSVTDMGWMFNGCSKLTSLDISNFNTSNVTRMSSMFSDCSSLTSIDVNEFDTSNVKDMGGMFNKCSSLTSLDVSGWNTSNVTSMGSMFYNCSSLTSLDASGFNTSKVTNMVNMFSNCSSLTNLDVSGFDTSKVTDMSYMFYDCSSLTSLDLSSFDTSNVTDMRYMFTGSSKLNRVKLGEDFAFNGNNTQYKALLPTPPSSTTTGKWILEDDIDGGSAMTPAQMRDAGTVTAGTWIWQEKPTKYTVIYHYNDGTGSTNTEKYVAAEAATLSSTYPARFNKIVTSWNTAEDGTGTSYELGATIPANTYAIGDIVDLYAIWEDSTAFTNVSEGVYQFQIPGNAQIKLDGLPAGTVYRVSEMLPNGWILVNQSNSSGSIGPLTNSVSTFINKYMPESASAAIYATKTMDGAPATEDMAFEFTLKEGENVIQTVTAANGAVLFDPIIYTSAGTHVYTIVENWETYSGPLDASGVTFDTHVETVTVEVTDDGEGKLSAEVTYDADGPAFANRTNPGDLIITKNVIGQTAANADDTFTFTIRIKSPTGGDINSASIEIGKLPTAEQSPEPTP